MRLDNVVDMIAVVLLLIGADVECELLSCALGCVCGRQVSIRRRVGNVVGGCSADYSVLYTHCTYTLLLGSGADLALPVGIRRIESVSLPACMSVIQDSRM